MARFDTKSTDLTDDELACWASGRPNNPLTDHGVYMALELQRHRAARLILDAKLDAMTAAALPDSGLAASAASCSRPSMSMKSPGRVKPGEHVNIVERPQFLAYRVEEIEINGDPSRWVVHEIIVGNRNQLNQLTGPIPGELFRMGVFMEIRLDTCQTSMNFTLVVEYIGPLIEGEVFEATLVGTAASEPPR